MNTHEQSDKLDQILLEQDSLLPSSGFAVSVMDAIQQQATAPAPIPFPWKLALPGIAALLAGFVVLCRLILTTIHSMSQASADGTDSVAWLHSATESAVFLRTEATPALLALAISFACVVLCRKLTGEWSTR
jgi:hypothetical protein